MKTLYKYRFIFFLLLISTTFYNCKKDAVIPVIDNKQVVPIKAATDVNKFVWEGLHDYYLWTSDVPNLAATKFSNADTLNIFLNGYSDPEALFYSLLYKYETVDKWSFIVDNSKEIDNWIAGISKTMGFDFMLAYIGQTTDLIGYVRYVLKGSPADLAGIKRGDLFTKVNGTQLTVSNYSALLLQSESYNLGLATITNKTIYDGATTATMTAVELQEDPVFMKKILDINGTKVGYLVYNGFTSDFDIELNDAFKDFKDAGIQKLIIDLRYNGGGSVQTAIYFASMIYSTDKTKVFAKSIYNKLLQDYIVKEYGESYLLDKFTDKIEKVVDDKGNIISPETPINSLNMNQVYFIVSDNTASASELLINGLKPYINVKTIGINTTGKYVGSMTLKDYDNNGNLNTTHNYAMQPIIVKIANSQGTSDYVNGLVPDITAEEDFVNLLPFGNENETLLKVALDDIRGISTKSALVKSGLSASKILGGLKDMSHFSKEMYVKPIKIDLSK